MKNKNKQNYSLELNDFFSSFDFLIKKENISKDEMNEFIYKFNILSLKDKSLAIKNEDSFKNTLLLSAADWPNEDLSIALINLGFNINAFNINGNSPLILSVKLNLTNLFDRIMQEDVDVNYARLSQDRTGNKVGATALMFAAEKGNEYFVKQLLNKNAEINYTNDIGQRAIIYSIGKKRGFFKCFKLLTKNEQTDKKLHYDKLGNNLLERILYFGTNDYLELFLDNFEFDQKTFSRVKEDAFSSNLWRESTGKNSKEEVQQKTKFVEKYLQTKKLEKELNKKNNLSLPKIKFKL